MATQGSGCARQSSPARWATNSLPLFCPQVPGEKPASPRSFDSGTAVGGRHRYPNEVIGSSGLSFALGVALSFNRYPNREQTPGKRERRRKGALRNTRPCAERPHTIMTLQGRAMAKQGSGHTGQKAQCSGPCLTRNVLARVTMI